MKKLFFLLLILNALLNAQVIIEGNITSDLTLTSDTTYMLRGIVRVQAPAKLIINPGVIIYGEYSSEGSLIIKPGAQIIAEGTVDEPIVFTSEFLKPGSTEAPDYGDWGGIILLGNAPINVPGGTAAIEGPGDTYGGGDENDNSGIMRYVRIEYPGIAYSLNNEINGLTFGGVGRGTTIEYIQVSYCGDDSFEWFGGTVNCKYLISYKAWDDDFDSDFGYQGKLQYLLAIRDPEVADQSKSNGFESDNDGSGSLNNPRTAPTWWNVTLIGPKEELTFPIHEKYQAGMHLRRSSRNNINNAIIMGWPIGLLIDGSTTTSEAMANTWRIKNSIIAGCVKSIDTLKAPASFDAADWFINVNEGRIFTNNSDVGLADPFNVDTPNAMPTQGSPALYGGAIPPNDGFFDTTANFIGAFGNVDWTAGWSSLNQFNPGVSVINEELNIEQYELMQNYPNPFNPATKIIYSIGNSSNVKLTVYNALGQTIALLVDKYHVPGKYEVDFNASNLPSGIYIYKLDAGNSSIARKMILMK